VITRRRLGLGRASAVCVIGLVFVLTALTPEAALSATRTLGQNTKLVEREGARGIFVRVPSDWTLEIVNDQGVSSSAAFWSDPADPQTRITATTGVRRGVDVVPGAIDPGTLIPQGADIQRLSATEFRYTLPANPLGYRTWGVWIAQPRTGEPLNFRQLAITAPRAAPRTISRILDSFVKAATPAPTVPGRPAASTSATTAPPQAGPDALAKLTATAAEALKVQYSGCREVRVLSAKISSSDPTWAYAAWRDVAPSPLCQGGTDYFRLQGGRWVFIPGDTLACRSWPADIGGFPNVMCR